MRRLLVVGVVLLGLCLAMTGCDSGADGRNSSESQTQVESEVEQVGTGKIQGQIVSVNYDELDFDVSAWDGASQP